MKVGDIVKIKAPGGGYWKGKITEISDAWRHTYKDGRKAVLRYTQPIATVEGVEGQGYAVVIEKDLKEEEDGVWVEN